MTTAALLLADLVVSLAAVVAWVAAAMQAGRQGGQRLLLAGALAVTALRAWSAVALAGRGWWFAEEKLLLAVPLLLVPAAVAAAASLAVVRRRTSSGTGATGRAVRTAATASWAAAYGAVAGLLATVVLGYPLTLFWSLPLVLGWAAAVAVTATRGSARWSRLGRAATVAAGLSVVLTLGVTWAGSLLPAEHDAGGHAVVALPTAGHPHGAAAVIGAADLGPAPRPGVWVDELHGPAGPADARFLVTARTATIELPSGRRVEAWTFNGTVPGPQLTVRQGDLVEVELRNEDIADGVTIHWHGYEVRAGEDGVAGVTQEAVLPGQRHTYRFQADQVGTYWYHSHQVGSRAVERGLLGALVVEPAGPTAAPPGSDVTLPVHVMAGAVLVGGSDGVLRYDVDPAAPARLRVINTDPRPHRIDLPGGEQFRVPAVDGRDLTGPGPVSGRAVRVPAGGRVDLEVTVTDRPAWLTVDRDPRVVLVPGGGAEPSLPQPVHHPLLDLFTYGGAARVPELLGEPDRRHTVVLDRLPRLLDGVPSYAHTVDGQVFPNVAPKPVRSGELVEVTIVNRGTETHPMHLHGHHVVVVSRDGVRPTGSPLRLDTVDVGPGEVWRVRFRADNPGIWLDHCHNLRHAVGGMVLHLQYEGVRTPFRVGGLNHPE